MINSKKVKDAQTMINEAIASIELAQAAYPKNALYASLIDGVLGQVIGSLNIVKQTIANDETIKGPETVEAQPIEPYSYDTTKSSNVEPTVID